MLPRSRKPKDLQPASMSSAKQASHEPAVAIDRKEEIVRIIEDEIIDGSLRPGQRLDERALAERFNISRTPIREILNRLATTGLVEIRRNIGMFVVTLTLTEVLELYEAVAEIEMAVTRLSTRRATSIQRQSILDLAKEFQGLADANDMDAFAARNIAFHETIYDACHNRYLAQLARQARRRVWAFRKIHFSIPGRMHKSAVEHMEIATAISGGDEAEIVRLLHIHGDIRSEAFNDFRMILSFTLGGDHSARN